MTVDERIKELVLEGKFQEAAALAKGDQKANKNIAQTKIKVNLGGPGRDSGRQARFTENKFVDDFSMNKKDLNYPKPEPNSVFNPRERSVEEIEVECTNCGKKCMETTATYKTTGYSDHNYYLCAGCIKNKSRRK